MYGPDIEKYAAVMKEVKIRTSVIDHFLTGKGTALYIPSTLETVALQFRKVLELIAFASLAANRILYARLYSDFSKHWNAGELLKNLARANPDFYPVPVIEHPSTQPGVKSHLEERKSDFLTQKQFVEAYGRCGVILHAANPYGHSIDFDYYQVQLPFWRAKMMNLLNSHKVTLVNEEGFYLVHMKEDGDEAVHYYRFEPVPAVSR